MNPPGTPAAWPWLAALPFLLSVLLNLAESAAVYLDDGELHRRKSAGERRAVTVAALLERHDRTELAVRIVSADSPFPLPRHGGSPRRWVPCPRGALSRAGACSTFHSGLSRPAVWPDIFPMSSLIHWLGFCASPVLWFPRCAV